MPPSPPLSLLIVNICLFPDQQLAGAKYLQPGQRASRHLSPLNPHHDRLLCGHHTLLQTECRHSPQGDY